MSNSDLLDTVRPPLQITLHVVGTVEDPVNLAAEVISECRPNLTDHAIREIEHVKERRRNHCDSPFSLARAERIFEAIDNLPAGLATRMCYLISLRDCNPRYSLECILRTARKVLHDMDQGGEVFKAGMNELGFEMLDVRIPSCNVYEALGAHDKLKTSREGLGPLKTIVETILLTSDSEFRRSLINDCYRIAELRTNFFYDGTQSSGGAFM